MMKGATKQEVPARLPRIAGQVEGLSRTVEGDRYCMNMLTQIAWARAALGRAGNIIPRSRVETCVRSALTAGKPKERKQKIDELMDVFSRFGCLGGGS